MNSSEQRSAFRIQMPDGQKRAALRIEGRSFDVQLVDASATGVAIACPLTVALDIDDRAELHTTSGGGMIRIVRKEVFSDGILLGAERLGDMSDSGSGLFGQIGELAMWPVRTFSASNTPAKIGLLTTLTLLLGGGAAVYFGWDSIAKPAVTVQSPVEVAPTEPTPAELQNVLRKVEALLPELTPVLSESDLRAQRIVEQQKNLLSPETSRRLRLTPSQESQIQRALEAADAAADAPSHEAWEAVRRCETQILKILTPSQIKIWRQQSGT
jgi:hypothetical protein